MASDEPEGDAAPLLARRPDGPCSRRSGPPATAVATPSPQRPPDGRAGGRSLAAPVCLENHRPHSRPSPKHARWPTRRSRPERPGSSHRSATTRTPSPRHSAAPVTPAIPGLRHSRFPSRLTSSRSAANSIDLCRRDRPFAKTRSPPAAPRRASRQSRQCSRPPARRPDDRVRGRLSEYRCCLPGLRHFSVWLEISFRVSAASCC